MKFTPKPWKFAISVNKKMKVIGLEGSPQREGSKFIYLFVYHSLTHSLMDPSNHKIFIKAYSYTQHCMSTWYKDN